VASLLCVIARRKGKQKVLEERREGCQQSQSASRRRSRTAFDDSRRTSRWRTDADGPAAAQKTGHKIFSAERRGKPEEKRKKGASWNRSQRADVCQWKKEPADTQKEKKVFLNKTGSHPFFSPEGEEREKGTGKVGAEGGDKKGPARTNRLRNLSPWKSLRGGT